MKFFRVFIFFVALTNILKAQTDSLFKQLNGCKDSTKKITLYLLIGNVLTEEGKDKQAISYRKKALELSKQINNTAFISSSLLGLGYSYSQEGAYSAALSCFLEELNLQQRKKNKKGTASVLSQMSVCYWALGENKKAIEYENMALQVNTSLNNKREMAGSYNNLGIYFRGIENYDKAINLYFKSIEICKEINDKRTLMQTLNNLAYIYQLIKNYEEALINYTSSYDLAKELNDELHKSITLGNIGALYVELKEFSKAEPPLLEALKISTDLSDVEGIRDINHTLSNLYQKTKNTDKAFFHYKNYIVARDSLKNEADKKDFIRGQVKYEYEKEKIELQKEQEKRDAVAGAEKNKQKLVIYSVSICLFVVILLSMFLYNRFKVTKAQKFTIEDQKKIVEEKNREIIDSIHYAQRIQKTLLAHHEFIDEHLPNNFVFFKPKDIVSGDFYWASEHNNKFYLAVCDSTGHGVPGAFMSLLNIGFLSEAINEKNISEPNKVLNHVRKRLIENISQEGAQDGMDAILICVEKLKEELKVTYAAANNAPILVHNNIIAEMPKDKMPVGWGIKKEPFTLHTIDIKKGDTLYLLTDGFADQFGGPGGKKFRHKQLGEFLLSIANDPAQIQVQKLNTAFENWRGDLEQVDDVCIIGIKI